VFSPTCCPGAVSDIHASVLCCYFCEGQRKVPALARKCSRAEQAVLVHCPRTAYQCASVLGDDFITAKKKLQNF